jgi:cellulose synthase/poly-beta-1,6-N-acetylglucosamine synthase-like glycosyltransferase
MDGLARASVGTAQDTTVQEACEGLARRHPAWSAKRVLTAQQAAAGVAIAAGLCAAVIIAPHPVGEAMHLVAMAIFGFAILLRLAAAAASLAPQAPSPPLVPENALPVITVLCPLYREANVAADLCASLNALRYPRELLDVKLILEEDDRETLAAVRAVGPPAFCEVLVAPPSLPRTKPKALNYAFASARGSIVTVFDAEDRPHPEQLRQAAAAFAAGGDKLACVQAPLLIDNADRAWISRQFAIEYAVQFGTLLPFLARMGLPFPLGGTSNYVRCDALRAVGGWDPYNVTEDADLGYRLARNGFALGTITAPTFEEAPVRFDAWLRQRTRWIKGHIQTWLVLMRDPLRSHREMGAAGFWSMQLALGGGIAASLLHGPFALWLLAAVLAPTLWLQPPDLILALTGYTTAFYAALAAAACTGQGGLIRSAPTMPFYWPLASIAALHALGELIVKPHYWAKTAHGQSERRHAGHAPLFLPRADRACGGGAGVSLGPPG